MTRRPVTVHHLPREAVRVAVLQVHLMPRLCPKIDKSCTKMATWNPSISEHYPFRPINIKTAPMTGLKWPPRAALDCQIWQFEVHTLNRRFGFFQSNQGLKSFPSWRQDCPLPPPINRVAFHGLRQDKIGSKIGRKTAPLPPFMQFFSPSLSPRFQPPTRAATSFSTTSSTTGSYPNHKPATPTPETTTVSSSLSLLQKSSSSPRGWLRPPLLAETPPEPPTKPLDYGRDSCFVWATPPPTSIFYSHFGCMQNVNHCSRSANN